MAAPVELGFVETTDSWRLKSKYFPSKVGGKPAWLNLRDLPNDADTSCQVCGKRLTFLAQIYAPVPEDDTCFHRTIFVFFCEDPSCCTANDARNFAVFRCQLPRHNEFYSAEPPVEIEGDIKPDATDYGQLCTVCGCLGPKRCSRCQTAYCSKEHQAKDWHLRHKHVCGKDVPRDDDVHKHGLLEFEIITEQEDESGVSKSTNSSSSEEQEMKQYLEYSRKLEPSITDEDVKDLDDLSTTTNDDRQFQRFRKRISNDPDQVMRYQRGGLPLWIASHGVPSDIPKCDCGASRQFEFQILPQLLNHLKLDDIGTSVDWGILAIYTCSRNCNLKAYSSEFIVKQDIVAKCNSGNN